ncbi:diacylglycerol kinase family lipid kinase [soil metagenome]
MIKQMQVIINPVAGQDEPVLQQLNTVLSACDVDWEIAITKQAGDARRFAQQAVRDRVDIVAAYGGDGTVAEVASGLVGSPVPLAILPGGTANVMARELGIPSELAQAARLACGLESRLEHIDVGQIQDHHFLLRAGVGLEAAVAEQADRSLKARFGMLAYFWSVLRNLRNPQLAHYQLVLDGQAVECAGVTCTIANAGSLGVADLKLDQAISIRDGLLDVMIVEEASWRALCTVLHRIFGPQTASRAIGATERQDHQQVIQGAIRHWQAKEISLHMAPMQVTQYDGEVLTPVVLPLTCKVLPGVLQVVTPNPATSSGSPLLP